MRINLFNKLKQRWRPFNRHAKNILVEIYSRPDCHLCDEAKATLLKMKRRFGFDLREINIAADEKLLAEYETRIPLIFVNGHLVCKYFVDEAAMIKRMTSV